MKTPLVAVLLVLSVGCATAQDSAPEAAAAGGAGAGGGAPETCTALDKCPPGMACFNGLCAASCNTDADCPASQRCQTSGDQLCHDRDIRTCPESECSASQVCANGYCSAMPSAGACGGSPFGNSDGCDAGAVCLSGPDVDGEPFAGSSCFVMPLCPDEGACPTGPFGAVCNDGLFPEKARICLAGLCTSKSNCPEGWSCLPAYANAPYGGCKP